MILVLQNSKYLSDVTRYMKQGFLRNQNYFFNQVYTSYMGISLPDIMDLEFFLHIFYNIVTSVIGQVTNNHVGFSGVDFCKMKTNFSVLLTLTVHRQHFSIML